MKRPTLIALCIAVIAGVWILSGQFNDESKNNESLSGGLIADNAGPASGSVLPRVRVRESTASEHGLELNLFGKSEEDRAVDVRIATSGHVAEIIAPKGSIVEESDMLLRLQMDDRHAILKGAEAEVDYREIAFEAAQSLAQKQFSAEVTVAGDLAALETAKAALEAVRLDIARTRVMTPFSGILEDIPVEIGDYVQTGDIMATIVDLDPIVVATEVTERQVSKVQLGHKADVIFANGITRSGAVAFISRSANEETRTFRVEIEVPNNDFAIPRGITADVTLFFNAVMAHLISPAIMTLSDDGRLGVKIVTNQNTVGFKPIEIIAETSDGVWVSGLPQTVRLITVGQEFVRVGHAVDAIVMNES